MKATWPAWRPVSLPRLSRAALPDRNRAGRRCTPLHLDGPSAGWDLRLQMRNPHEPPRDGLVELAGDWGTARAVLRAERSWLDGVVRQALGVEPVPDAPPLLQQALLEMAFDAAMGRIERASGRPLRLSAAPAASSPDAGWHGLDWQASSPGQLGCGELWLDDAGLRQLAQHATSPSVAHEAGAAPDPRFEALPIPVRLAVGWVDLPARQAGALAVHDVLLLDESWMQPDGTLTLRVGRRSGLQARVCGTRLEVTQAWTDIMDDRLDDDELDDDFDDDLDDDDDEDDDFDDDDDGLDDGDLDDPTDETARDTPAMPRRVAVDAPKEDLFDDEAEDLDDETHADPRAAVAAPGAPLASVPSSIAGTAPVRRRSAGVHLDALPVRLSFDLGQRTLTLAELREIGPGHVFDLGRELRKAVRVRANGRLVGEGELVDVDGRLGVCILALEGDASC